MDLYQSAMWSEHRVVVGIALTTQTCGEAKKRHGLAPTSAVALGRLLTATALCKFIHPQDGTLSLQVVCTGRLKQIFADITAEGHLRGYVRNPDLALPPVFAEHRRRKIALGVSSGTMSMVRLDSQREYRQSSVEISSGEIDDDVQHFLQHSDQIPTALVCDVLLDKQDDIAIAAGIIARAMPDGEPEAVTALKESLSHGKFAKALSSSDGDLKNLLAQLIPDARLENPPQPLLWKCRCSAERVYSALSMLGPIDLAEMIDAGENADVTCDFCGAVYEVSPQVIQDVFERTMTGQAN